MGSLKRAKKWTKIQVFGNSNFKVIFKNPQMASESGMLDNGQSAKELYRVDNFDLVQVPEEDYGKFYKGDDKKNL